MSKPYEQVMVLDFETAWSTRLGYTLTKMTTEEYIRDPRFIAWGLAWKWLGEEGPAIWVRGSQIEDWVKKFDWTKIAVLAHNAQFDCGILSFIYGVKPCFYFDSLSMARALRGIEKGNSLRRLAEMFGLPPKGDAVHSSDGWLFSLPFEIELELAEYCKHDVFLCESIFSCLVQGISGVGDAAKVYSGPYPKKELRLIDMTIRMFCNPVLELDKWLLRTEVHAEKDRREALLTKLGVDEKTLASTARFAGLLVSLGYDAPMKPSPTNNRGMIYAFAKTDARFQQLLNGEDETLSQLCEARLLVKSTLERTRGQRLLDIANRGPLPVPLRYYAAHTGRWGGDGAINLQNLGRKSFLRAAIRPPAGYVLVVADLRQIEPRVLAWLADYWEVLRIFASGKDVYASFGAQMFGVPGMTQESHPELRQSAKSGLLGCGYGMGWANLATQLLVGFLGAPPVLYNKAFARKLGVTSYHLDQFYSNPDYMIRMGDIPHTCDAAELFIHCVAAKQIVDKYRAAAQPVVALWRLCDEFLTRSLAGGQEIQHKILTFKEEEIVLPNGMSMHYPGLHGAPDEKGRIQWIYGTGKKLHGPKIVENITQAIARIVMTDGLLRVQKRYPVLHSAHDEGTMLVPEKEADEARAWIYQQMIEVPVWMPELPLDATVGVGYTYKEAKG